MKQKDEEIESGAEAKEREAAEKFRRKPKGCRHHWPMKLQAQGEIGFAHCVNCGEPYGGKAR